MPCFGGRESLSNRKAQMRKYQAPAVLPLCSRETWRPRAIFGPIFQVRFSYQFRSMPVAGREYSHVFMSVVIVKLFNSFSYFHDFFFVESY